MPVQTQLQQRRGTAASWTSTNPTLAAGEIGFETDTGKFKIGNGSTAWAALAYNAAATAVTYLFNATSGQTTFSGADANGLTLAYTVGAEQVYLNGVLQVRGSDYTATNGTSIVLASGALTSDVLNVIAYSAMTVTDTYTQAQADAKFVPNALVDAKGDLFTATADNTPARLAVGSNNQVLTADSSTATGLKWAAVAAGGQSWAQVATGSTTSGSSLALTSLSGYDNYLLMWNDVQVTTSSRPSYTIRFNADSGTNYDYSLVRQTGSTTAGAGAFSAAQSHADNIYMDNGLSNFIAVRISGCKSTTGYKTFTNQLATITNAGVAANVISSGIYKSNSAITSINLALASNTFIQGTYYLYGSN